MTSRTLTMAERWSDCMDATSCRIAITFLSKQNERLAADIIDANVQDDLPGDDLYWYKKALHKEIRRNYRAILKLERRLPGLGA